MSTNNPTHSRTRSTNWIVAMIAAACLASAALLAINVVGVGKPSAASQVNPAPVGPVVPVTPTPAPAHHGKKPTPVPAKPSEAMRLVQRELSQLNYYDGAINGYDTAQTIQAIKYLQRDAKLRRTGVLDAATQTALITFLIESNNQMAH